MTMSQNMQEQNNSTNKPMANKLTETQYIIAFYECGMSIYDIAQMYGKAESTILRIVKTGK
jgi:DNA-binding NarL/FixJ family response regulator